MSTKAAEPTFYSSDYSNWKGWAVDQFGRYSQSEAAAFAAELSRAGIPTSQPTRILEIGFGNGAFLGWARDTGYPCEGVEINAILCKLALNAGFTAYPSLDRVPSEAQYQLIVALDVIEHVADHDLPGLFASIRSKLADGGLLIIRSPNGDSPFGRYYQNGDITHLSAIGTHKLRQLAMLTGYGIEYILPPALPRTGALAMLKRSCLDAVRSMLEYFLCRLYFHGQKVNFSPNLVAVLRHIDQ